MISFSAELNGVPTVYVKPSIQAYETVEEGYRAVSHHVINQRYFSPQRLRGAVFESLESV